MAIVRYWYVAGLALIASEVCSAPLDEYAAHAIEGTVVDARSRKPMAGAVVEAAWVLEPEPAWEYPHPPRFLRFEQVRSDARGRFRLASWQGARAPLGWRLKAGEDPRIRLYATVHLRLTLDNTLIAKGKPPRFFNPPEARERRSRHHGQTHSMKRPASAAAWKQELLTWRADIERTVEAIEWRELDLAWMSVRHLLLLFEQQCRQLPEADQVQVCFSSDSKPGLIARNLLEVEEKRGKHPVVGTQPSSGIIAVPSEDGEGAPAN